MHITQIKAKNSFLKLTVMGLVFAALPRWSYANGELVYDPVVAGKIVAETQQDLDVLNETLAQGLTLKDQLATAKQQYSAMVGQYGAGTWNMQGQNFINNWQTGATTWQQQLQGLSGGNQARYQELLSQYKDSNDSMSEEEFHKTFSAATSKALTNQVNTNQAAGTASQQTFENVNAYVTDLKSLGDQVEDSAKNPNSKSAIDINTRAQIENGLINSQMVLAQTVSNNMAASNQAASIASAVQAAKFNADPTHN